MSLQDPNIVNPRARKRVAIVIANPTQSTTTGWPVGFWWSELTHPYLSFHEAGYEVELFSPDGGPCQADGMSDPNDTSGYSKTDLISQGFIHSPELMAQVQATRKVAEIDVAAFDAIVVAGGQAPMFNFEGATELHQKFAAFFEAGKVAAALCHGCAILAYAKTSAGEYIAKGRTVTGFANVEEDFADNAVWSYGLLPRDRHVMPRRIEDRLKAIGANYVQGGLWRSFAVRDGNLITGQQNFSGADTARLVVEALGAEGDTMDICFIGYGQVGAPLADHLQRLGHRVSLAARELNSDAVRAAQARNPALLAVPLEQAVQEAQVVFLATPFAANAQTVPPLAQALAGKALVDCTNPVGPGFRHGLNSQQSGAQALQAMAPQAQVVKAFSIYGFENLENNRYPVQAVKPAMLFCGDHAPAKASTAGLISQLGWEPVDVGGLEQALHLEHMTLLWVRMVRANGHSPHLAWAALRR